MNRDYDENKQQNIEQNEEDLQEKPTPQIENFEPDEEFDSKFDEQESDPYSWADEPRHNADEKTADSSEQMNSEQTIISAGRILPPLTPARRIAEGALMVALSTVLGVLAFYAPLFDLFLLILYPIPLAYLIKRHNISTGLIAFVASALLLTLLLGITNAAFVILSMGAVGIWYGVAFRKNIKPIRALCVGVVLAALSTAVTTMLSLWTMGTSAADLTAYLTSYVDSTVKTLQSAGVFEMMAGGMTATEYTQNMVNILEMLVPGMLIIVSMLEALLCYVISGYILRRLGLAVQTLPKFREWRLSWPALWGLIIALLAYIGYHYLEYQWLKTIALNILYIYYPILMITGISLLVWLRKNTGSLAIPIMVIIGFFIFPSAAIMAVMMFGLFDTIVDFRGWVKKNAQRNQNRK